MPIVSQSEQWGLPVQRTASFHQSEVQDLLAGNAIMAGLMTGGKHDGPAQEEYQGRHRRPDGPSPELLQEMARPSTMDLHNMKNPPAGIKLPANPNLAAPDVHGTDPGMEQLEALTSRHGFDPEDHYERATGRTQQYADDMLSAEPWSPMEQSYHSGPDLYEDQSVALGGHGSPENYYREHGLSGV